MKVKKLLAGIYVGLFFGGILFGAYYNFGWKFPLAILMCALFIGALGLLFKCIDILDN
jgi:hypothetical protein